MVLVMPMMRGLGRGVMPVLRAVAAPACAARDIDDAAAALLAEMGDGEPAEIGRRLQVDLQRARPASMPIVVGSVRVDAFVDAGIVDQRVDAAVRGGRALLPRSRAAPPGPSGRRQSDRRRPWSNGRQRYGRCDFSNS